MTLRARTNARDASVPLHHTTILPIPTNTALERRRVEAPEWGHLRLLEGERVILHTSEEELDDLSRLPLRSVTAQADMVEFLTRADQGLPSVDPQLPFQLEHHECAHKAVARSMLDRLRSDMSHFAEKQNSAAQPKLRGLSRVAQAQRLFRGEDESGLAAAVASLERLAASLRALREADQRFVAHAMPVVVRSANDIEAARDTAAGGTRPATGRDRDGALLSLRRIAELEAELSLEYLIASLCSSTGESEWLQLNPFLTPSTCEAVIALMSTAILRANRIGHVNRCSEAEELILDMHRAITSGTSVVKQMIMGAGKTTVVGPLLALMLADRSRLVIQVVPPALLDFSRSVLRTTFGSVLQKQIFSFVCDRASDVDSEILQKFDHAKQSRAIVVTTPSSVKSIFLKFIECVDRIADPDHPQRAAEDEREARDLLRCLRMWRESVLIMDEVDLLLHPLKSELNFPIGAKRDIDFTPTRWRLPIHLIDAIFYYHTHRVTTAAKDSPEAHDILREFRAAVQYGLEVNALQEMPHLALLNLEYYEQRLKPILARWTVVFFKAQHLTTSLSDADTIRYLLKRPVEADDAEFYHRVAAVDAAQVKVLNLAYEWLSCFLPHVLQKIDRVAFGIMNAEDMRRARDEHPNMPRSRFVTAIPFIGKDLPSPSSEFAHPDVVIGLTVLAYRYEGFRTMDFTQILRELHVAVEKEVGRYSQRRTNVMFVRWVQASGGRILSNFSYKAGGGSRGRAGAVAPDDDPLDGGNDDGGAAGMQPSESMVVGDDGEARQRVEVLPLKLLKQANAAEVDKLFKLFRRTAEVVHWYLGEIVFPQYMRHQDAKLSASGQELGGSIVFQQRVGFSGTPSDLLPVELGRCEYERGTDGQLIHTLTDPAVVLYNVVETGWNVRGLLDRVAQSAQPPFHALIDTGALITGMSNLQVARYLLRHGLEHADGVVFLDELDRKMILVRATGRVLKLAECGIPKARRFAFYDQVHTTGMDIEHLPNAIAVQTLGKDMTFRDFSQGAYRMRGIGQGQTVRLLIIPEVYDLMLRTLGSMRGGATVGPALEPRAVLVDITAWLLVNSIRSEHMQHNQLSLQSCANTWRKHAFEQLGARLGEFVVRADAPRPSVEALGALRFFREAVTFTIASTVPQPRMFSASLQRFINDAMALMRDGKMVLGDSGRGVIEGIVRQSRAEDELDNPVVDVQMVQEQEEEKDQDQEQEKEQHIEIEKFVDLAYSRDEERPTPWRLDTLRDMARAPQFYRLSEFHLYKRRSLAFPSFVYLSRNYFNSKWSGHRRIRNTIVAMEWTPSTGALRPRAAPSQDYGALNREESLVGVRRTMAVVGEHDPSASLSPSILKDVLLTAFHVVDPQSPEWGEVLAALSACELGAEGKDSPEDALAAGIVDVLRGNVLRGEEDGRYIVAVTLLEAETLRRVIHLRSRECSLLPGSDCAIALHLSPSNFTTIDRSVGYVASPTTYMHAMAYQSLRFFDCDLHFTDAELGVLLRAVHGNVEKHRQAFFQQVLGCRRRSRQRWERTPVALLFVLRDALRLLHQRVLGLCIRRHLERLDLHLGDAFMAFNHSHSGSLSPDELWGSLRFCGLRSVDVGEVLDFLDVADSAHEGSVQYPDFLSVLTGARELDDDMDGSAAAADEVRKLPTVEPHGAEVLAAAMSQRAARQREQEVEANKELEVENQRVMDEIEEEQIAEELALVQAEGNPALGDTSLSFDFGASQRSPKLAVPFGARVRRAVVEGEQCTVMHGTSGIRLSLRLLKRLLGRPSTDTYAVTIELRLPRPPHTDKGLLAALAKAGNRSLTLFQWPLPMLRFLGFKSGTLPHFEADIFGAVAPRAEDDEMAAVERALKRGAITAAQAANRQRVLEQRRVAAGAGDGGGTHPIHILGEPRPPRAQTEAVGSVAPNGFVVVTDDKTSNAIDGVTYEWVRVLWPAEGWVVRERNGKALWDRIGTTVSVSDKQVTVNQGPLGVVATELGGTIDETTEEEQRDEAKVSQHADDDANPVELHTDVGDLLEAIRRAKRLKAGDKVTRNAECWDRDNEDGGAGKVGKVLRVENDKVEVQWPGGNKGSYHWGHQGRFELVKVGEADSDDEGDMREVMNDDRWLPDLRKGGAKCNNCGALKLEAGNWFRCNHCDAYHLCRKCFRAGHHGEHDFTDMAALGEGAATDVGPGATVSVKLSITNPRFGWQGVEPGMTGVVLDMDTEDHTATVEMANGQEWQCDLNEIEVVQVAAAEADEAPAPQLAYAMTIAVGELLPGLGTPFPHVAALAQFARGACLPKFAVGDRVKVCVQRNMCPAEVRAVVPERKEYALAVDGLGFRTGVHESNMQTCPLRLGDRVRFARAVTKPTLAGAMRESDRLRAVGTVMRMQPYNSQSIVLEVQFEDLEMSVRALDREVDVVGTGKWTMHPTSEGGEDGASASTPGPGAARAAMFALPTSSNVLVERAFMDGVAQLNVFIRDDLYDVDLRANTVTRGGRLVGRLSRDPPEAFVAGEEKKQLDDGFTHLVTLVVVDGAPALIVDGRTMAHTVTGCLQGLADGPEAAAGAEAQLHAAAMSLRVDTPLTLLHSTCNAEMARQAVGAAAVAAFPQRNVTRVTVEWGAGVGVDAVVAQHAAVEQATSWPCRECRAANPRWVDTCQTCRAPKTARRARTTDGGGRFRCAAPKSRESALVRGKLQGKLRAQYQRELDLLDQAMESMAAAAAKGGGPGKAAKGTAAGPAPAPAPP